jgi:hypothetical protein
MPNVRPLLLALVVLPLAGCDALGIDTPEKIAAVREADGKAIGGACRHAGRAIEDCFALNRKADRAAIFAGWREMNDYMRENNIEPITPQLTAQVGVAGRSADARVDAAPQGQAAPAVPGKSRSQGQQDS